MMDDSDEMSSCKLFMNLNRVPVNIKSDVSY